MSEEYDFITSARDDASNWRQKWWISLVVVKFKFPIIIVVIIVIIIIVIVIIIVVVIIIIVVIIIVVIIIVIIVVVIIVVVIIVILLLFKACGQHSVLWAWLQLGWSSGQYLRQLCSLWTCWNPCLHHGVYIGQQVFVTLVLAEFSSTFIKLTKQAFLPCNSIVRASQLNK